MGQVITKESLTELISGIIKEQGNVLNEDQEKKFAMLVEGKFAEYSAGIEKKFVPQDVTKIEGTHGFGHVSEFAKAVFTEARTRGRVVDPRLLTKAAGTPSQAENDMEAGGYLVPPEFANQLLSIAIEKSDIMGRCTHVPMQTNSINYPIINGFDRSGGLVHGGVQYYWVDEEGVLTATNVKIGRVTLNLQKVVGLSYVSSELMEDSPISITPLIENAFGDALIWTLDDVFITGSGAGKPLGILNAPCKITVTKETGQAAGTVVFENLVKMYARIWRDSNAVWMVNRGAIPQLATMSMAVGTGGVPVYLPANGVSGRPYSTLFGLPLMFSEHCSAPGTAGDVILVDWSQYLVGQKAGANLGVKTAYSIHLKFDYDQSVYRIVLRICGQPWWPSVLQPHRGGSGATLSPVVELGARA